MACVDYKEVTIGEDKLHPMTAYGMNLDSFFAAGMSKPYFFQHLAKPLLIRLHYRRSASIPIDAHLGSEG
jgi:hypothetical protein